MIFWRVIRFSDEIEATNWHSSGRWSCLPAVEWDVWPVGEVGARNVGKAACITLKLLLYYDCFVLENCFEKLFWGIMLAQWPLLHYHSFNTGLQTHEDLQSAGYFELGCETRTTGIFFREVPGKSEIYCYILINNKEVELIEHHTFLSLNI